MSPPLAHAFLALADDPVATEQRTLPRALAAAVAAAVLAIGTPLTLVVADQQVAALSSKVSLAQDDE
jgi:hypothetical protein